MTSINPFEVRRADATDAPRLFDFLLPLYVEVALQPVSATKLRTMVERCAGGDRAMAGLIEGPAGIEASIALAIEEFDYTDAEHLRIKWAFVYPAFRRMNHLHRLMQFAAWCYEGMLAMSPAAMPLIGDILTVDELEPKMRLYQRSLPQVGAMFALGCVPENAFDQLRLDDGRGDRGRSTSGGSASRQRSPLMPRKSPAAA